ncbi:MULTISPECIES: lipoprotein-releasing ABC transporter permease subunit LolC [unclassified Vibrio]|uniref:Lipoprotein-releasing ABC transporter permease subunit LolC n=1 Tax=Vibrio sp. HB236076 TaxID=3232307 RepID=A0AB39HDV2_9VIBR|nr:lipoprotein-releasing ABC transporter permease subunit LolC [Vibrio sp. HB161653]MDP5255111.1 lipoprotein-releasing ABC transporter permease subunit LolC [Vibrio sp. HB161653]
MFRPLTLFIGFRYLKGRSTDKFSRFVTIMSTAGIGIGVLALIAVLSVMNGFEQQLKQRILGVLPQAVISQQGNKTEQQEQAPPWIQQRSPARQPLPLVRSDAVIQSASQLSAGYLLGIEPGSNDPIGNYMMVGQVSSLQAGEYRVLLGQRLAQSLAVNVGDKVRLLVTDASQYTPFGRIPSQRNFTVAGVFSTGSDVDGQLMVTNIADAGRLLHLKSGFVTGWRLFFDDPFDAVAAANQPVLSQWQWHDWREQRGELFQAVKMEKNMMGLMLGLIVFVAAFNIISALIMVVMEKQSEVAILKTQGMKQSQIMAIFMSQGALSGVLGALIGGVLGVLITMNLNAILSAMGIELYQLGGGLPVVIAPLQIVLVIILAIVLSLVATLYPAYRASSVKPAEALRYE